jgi:hypothetical protein
VHQIACGKEYLRYPGFFDRLLSPSISCKKQKYHTLVLAHHATKVWIVGCAMPTCSHYEKGFASQPSIVRVMRCVYRRRWLPNAHTRRFLVPVVNPSLSQFLFTIEYATCAAETHLYRREHQKEKNWRRDVDHRVWQRFAQSCKQRVSSTAESRSSAGKNTHGRT